MISKIKAKRSNWYINLWSIETLSCRFFGTPCMIHGNLSNFFQFFQKCSKKHTNSQSMAEESLPLLETYICTYLQKYYQFLWYLIRCDIFSHTAPEIWYCQCDVSLSCHGIQYRWWMVMHSIHTEINSLKKYALLSPGY